MISTGVRGRDMGIEEGTGKETEMRMLRWICGVTKLDMKYYAPKNGQDMRLKWNGHVLRSEEYAGNGSTREEEERKA